jgi:hypothetical protein
MTKFLAILILLFLSSCGLFRYTPGITFYESKGFDPHKDTTIIKPYQFFIKHKGSAPNYGEINTSNRLDNKIGIRGFEVSDTIPLEKLFEEMEFVIDDTTLALEYGELSFSRAGYRSMILFGKMFGDCCRSQGSFSHIKERRRKIRKGDILFFWNVHVIKDGITYAIPSRVYTVK